MGGVCGAVAARIRWDVTLVRILAIIFGLSGFGLAAYVLGWLFIPLQGEETSIGVRSVSDTRGLALAVAMVPLYILVVLVSTATGIAFLNSFSWSLALSGAGLVLVVRNAGDEEKAELRRTFSPLVKVATTEGASRRNLVVRVAVGVVLLVAGLAVLIADHRADTARAQAVLRPLSGLLFVIAAVVVLFGPWWLRLARDLVNERQARARAEERADMAARVHDSVLQTLALIQRQSDQPDQVVKLARAQERELRSWLFDGQVPGAAGARDETLAAGIARIQQSVEANHGVNVDAVVVGDSPLDDGLRGLLDAGREAVVNASKWSGAPVVSVYAEVEAEGVSLFVRDRGAGFDPEAVPEDRKGVSESIRGRMRRLGGTATIRSAPGQGTEVALHLPLPRRERRSAGAAR